MQFLYVYIVLRTLQCHIHFVRLSILKYHISVPKRYVDILFAGNCQNTHLTFFTADSEYRIILKDIMHAQMIQNCIN